MNSAFINNLFYGRLGVPYATRNVSYTLISFDFFI